MGRKKKKSNRGGFRPGSGRKKEPNAIIPITVGFRPCTWALINKKCAETGETSKHVIEGIVNEAIMGYYGTPDQKILSIVETSGLKMDEVIPILLRKATQ